MKSRQLRVLLLRASVLLAGTLGALGAGAQEVVQTLDQVKAYSANDVLDMTFNDPYRTEDFTRPATPISSASAFVACKQTSAAGLICLTADEKIVNWSDPLDGASRTELFSCNDVTKILDTRATNTCTSVTADEIGAIWLAGKNKGKTHSLVKVTYGACQDDTGVSQTFTSSTGGGSYCAREWDTGRPLLLSVKRVEGQLAERFDDLGGGDTVLGLEQRLNAVIFSATNQGAYYAVPGGKSGWGLGRKEDLQDIALLQRADGEDFDNYLLVATTEGRVMAKDMANPSATAYQVWPNEGVSGCATPGAVVSLAASPKGEIIYIGNSSCEEVVALRADHNVLDSLKLVPATELRLNGNTGGEPVPPLSTKPYEPIGIAVAPGQDFKLEDCGSGNEDSGGCSQVPGARLYDLQFKFVDGMAEDSGVTALQIINIPDCRWLMSEENDQDWPVPSECAGTLFDPDGVQDPAGEYLDIKPLLPREVRDVLVAKNAWLPTRLLIAPQHRAQYRNKFRFDALFFIVDESVQFTGIFEGEFDPELLTREQLESRCYKPGTEVYTDGLDWDIVTKVSEQRRYISVDERYQDMLLNTGCGSSRTSSISLSVYSYPLEITPDTYVEGKGVVKNNDAVFARYIQKLFYDLDYVARQYACNVGNNPDYGHPVSSGQCTTLLSGLDNAGDKLGKCIAATYQPKQSAGNQNCTSFLQQWASVKATIASIIASDAGLNDPANRRYELEQRRRVFDHVYDTRFWPSVPSGGFCVESGTCP